MQKRLDGLKIVLMAAVFLSGLTSLTALADVTVSCLSHQIQLTGEEIKLEKGFKGTLISTSHDGEIQLMEEGDPDTRLDHGSTLEVIEGSVLLNSKAGTSIECECSASSGKVSVLSGEAKAILPAGLEKMLLEGSVWSFPEVDPNGAWEGDAVLERGGNPIGITGKLQILEGDIIRTSGQTHLDIRMNEKVDLRLLENTELEIKRNSDQDMYVYLKAGDLMVRIPKQSEAVPFTVETPTAVAAVRGTIFLIRAMMKDQKAVTVVAVSESIVDILVKQSDSHQSVGAGEAIEVTQGDDSGFIRSLERGEIRLFFYELPGALKSEDALVREEGTWIRKMNRETPDDKLSPTQEQARPTAAIEETGLKTQPEIREPDSTTLARDLDNSRNSLKDKDDTDQNQSPFN